MKRCILVLWWAAIGGGFLAEAAAQRVVFVDDLSVGANDGSSWKDAYADLQDALDNVRDFGGCPCEIWIAEGVYRPDRRTGDRFASFDLPHGIALYGGFAGWEGGLDQRDPAAHKTVLSGDLNQDDEPRTNNQSDCCYETLLPRCEVAACADAVIAEPTAERPCAYQWTDYCAKLAQSFCCDVCRPSRCENSIHVLTVMKGDSVLIDGVVITGGEANYRGEERPMGRSGGGLLAFLAGPLTLRNVIFRDNAGSGRGAIEAADAIVDNSMFVDNVSFSRTPVVSLLDLPDNGTMVTVTDSIFLRNTGGGLDLSAGGTEVSTLERCEFIENSSFGLSEAAGIFGSDVALVIKDSLFLGNTNTALRFSGAATIVRSKFIGNSDPFWTAGVDARGPTILKNCLFSGNRSGGGISFPIPDPVAGSGGAFQSVFGFTVVENCTFFGNVAGATGGMGSSGIVTNSIFYGNFDYIVGFGEAAQLGGQNLEISNSIVQGWTGARGGEGNSGVYPVFVDAYGLDRIIGTEDDDLRLDPYSPAVDAGVVNSQTQSTDVDGHPRVLCDSVDLGAYELFIPGPEDCYVGLFDHAAFLDCIVGPNQQDPSPQRCVGLDANFDNIIDLADFAFLQRAFNGP